MSDVLECWSLPYTIKTITKQTVDFVESNTVTARVVRAVVQPAEKEKLNPDKIDWSLAYLQIHSAEQLFDGEFIEYNGSDYKIIADGNYQLYGFSEVIAEQSREPVIAVP